MPATIIAPETNIPQTECVMTLADWLRDPPKQTEWVDGEVIEKTDMTLNHGRLQGKIAFYWRSYMLSSGAGGEVYTEAPCQTVGRGRKPDVAYLVPELVSQFGALDVLPQSFSLIAEIISPTDRAEEVFAKASEYIASGCQEVWLVFPENRAIFVIAPKYQKWFGIEDAIASQSVLLGFTISVRELFA